ncbi:MAG TPA: class I SAM-dependent methyltransferase [Baekduia sp.]|jgi:predicted O-methyltransferase YrrM
MTSTLRTDAVVGVLDRLVAAGLREDEPGKERVVRRETELGHKVYGRERAELYGTAPIAVTREVGELLYVLATAAKARMIVEFGASVGFSTIHLAAAARDTSDATVITTELDERKAQLAHENLAAAGLADLVDLRVGDAQTTLADLSAPVDLLFIDGWNDLYLPILALVEPRLRPGALVIADLSAGDPSCEAYRTHVEDPANGYFTITLPLDAGVTVSTR